MNSSPPDYQEYPKIRRGLADEVSGEMSNGVDADLVIHYIISDYLGRRLYAESLKQKGSDYKKLDSIVELFIENTILGVQNRSNIRHHMVRQNRNKTKDVMS